MRIFFIGLLLLNALSASTPAATAAEPGWVIDQISNAQGKQHVLVTPQAISITLPKQKYRIYSFAPKWNVIYINDQVGTYIDFPHAQFMGSIMGRLGNQLGNDIQMLPLPKPHLVNKDGFEYAVYDHKLALTPHERQQMRIKNSIKVLYGARAIKAKYLCLTTVAKEAKELACKVSCVPMSFDYPIEFSCTSGFQRILTVLTTAGSPQKKYITITPPDLKNLKRVKTESELFSSARVNDVFELFGEPAGEKKNKQ
ncbi:MAG: hypothetical protein IT342_23995 [Candidatus Melainabacteria bacterium]|nr:hypothetical protein [Candidatus Melainabacteria bacterium]